MGFWKILEIDPTVEESIIKKAYSKKLKIFHPEDNPEGYQNLREAYDSAIKYAKAVKNNSIAQNLYSDSDDENIIGFFNNSYIDNNGLINIDDGDKSNIINDLNNNKTQNESENTNYDINNNIDISSPITEFIKEANNIYNDYFSRIELKNWEALMNSDVMWDISYKENLSVEMLDFLMEHHLLPQSVWRLLDSHFNWLGNAEDFSIYYSEEFIEYIYSIINLKKDLNYACFKSVENIDYDKFFENREKAYLASANEDWEDVGSYVREAKEIYNMDADTLYIEILYYKAIDNFSNALIKCNELLTSTPDYAEAIYERGKINFRNKLYEKALEDFLQSEVLGINNTNLYQLIALSSHELKDYFREKEYYSKVLINEPEDDRVKDKILSANKKIRKSLQKDLIKHIKHKDKFRQYKCYKREERRFNKQYNIKRMTFGSRLLLLIGIIFWAGLVVCLVYSANNNINTNKSTSTNTSESEYLYGNFELDKVPNNINVSDIKFSNIFPLGRSVLQTTIDSEPLITPIYRTLMLGNFHNKIYILAMDRDLENNYELSDELHYSGYIKTLDNREIDLPTYDELNSKLTDTKMKILVLDRYLAIDTIIENSDEGNTTEAPAIFLTIGGFIIFVVAVIRGFKHSK